MGSLIQHQIKHIAIVGAGPAGVAAAKYLLAEDYFDKVDIFEQRDTFGGAWNYFAADVVDHTPVPQTNPHQPLESPRWRKCRETSHDEIPSFSTPMYDGLETNIPHSLMKHPDDPSLEHNQLFPTRETVLSYLTTYASSIKSLVQFHTQVIDVSLQNLNGTDSWSVQTRNLKTGRMLDTKYDAVIVASGHLSVPALPEIRGIKDWHWRNPGIISHSKHYRNPAGYVGKKTLVVGNSASGVDISAQVARVAKLPVIVSQRSPSTFVSDGLHKKDVPEIAEFLPESQGTRAVRFADGQIETHLDAVLFCTGYHYSFPFLTSLKPPLIDTGERAKHLYKHVFYIYHPSLAVVGFPSKIIPFRTFEGQVAVIARIWSDRLQLPSVQEMEEWEERRIRERGAGRAFHVLPFPDDLDYHNEMIEWASGATNAGHGKMPLKWDEKDYWTRERFAGIKKEFVDRGENRRNVRTMENLGYNYEVWLEQRDANNDSTTAQHAGT